jgi:YfiH family protein
VSSKFIKSYHQWEWCYSEGLPYLTCSLFKDWPHGFFTKQFIGQLPSELGKILNPNTQAYRVKQVHGNTILTPSEIELTLDDQGEKTFSEADGIISDARLQSVWVASADCTPVLIADSQTGRVAAVHAGWRGTAQRIVPEAIALFLAKGSSIENLIFALGPAITGEVYQVTEEVAVEVGRSLISVDEAEEGSQVLQLLREIPESPILDDSSPGKVKLDVRKIISLQLGKLGINPEKMAIAPYCTYQESDYFFSYRRTKEKKVQWSGIFTN